ncbi:hypothetical protein FGB62_48g071 [Gracilaria domingensis]|nr:hypothetical protein FGB62_48g071 [Gracilaria domingensis]
MGWKLHINGGKERLCEERHVEESHSDKEMLNTEGTFDPMVMMHWVGEREEEKCFWAHMQENGRAVVKELWCQEQFRLYSHILLCIKIFLRTRHALSSVEAVSKPEVEFIENKYASIGRRFAQYEKAGFQNMKCINA